MKRLVKDQRGAIMVMGVFMAALLVGFLYYVKGLGEMVALKERMQDAADTAAFSAAVVHARGMNIIALLNIVAAAVLAAAVASRALGTVMAVAALIATYTVGLSGQLGAGSAFCGLSQSGQDGSFTRLFRTAGSVMAVSHTAAVALRQGVPLAAQAQVLPEVERTYRPLVEQVFLWPVNPSLPVTDASVRVHCERAGITAADLVALPFVAGGVAGLELFTPGVVAFHALEIARQMCEPRDGPPDLNSGGEYSTWGPLPPEAHRCLSCDDDNADCGAAQALLDRIHQRNDEGGCITQECRDNTDEARNYCAPGPGRPAMTAARFQVCNQVQPVVGGPNGIVENQGTPTVDECELIENQPLPCTTTYDREGTGPICETSLEPANLPPATPSGRRLQNPQPVATCTRVPDAIPPEYDNQTDYLQDNPGSSMGCNNGFVCLRVNNQDQCYSKLPQELAVGEVGALPTVRVVTLIHQCAFPVTENRIEAFDVPRLQQGPALAPQRLLPGAGPGAPVYQVRSVAGGNPKFGRKDEGVKVGSFGQDVELSPNERALRAMGRVNIAQAEYYFDGNTTIDEWVWQMRWRARLKRYRLPEDLSNASACPGLPQYCEALDHMMQRGLDDAVTH